MKGLLSELGMSTFTVTAMLISFAAFLAIVVWTTTRPQAEIDAQARLYEDDGPA